MDILNLLETYFDEKHLAKIVVSYLVKCDMCNYYTFNVKKYCVLDRTIHNSTKIMLICDDCLVDLDKTLYIKYDDYLVLNYDELDLAIKMGILD